MSNKQGVIRRLVSSVGRAPDCWRELGRGEGGGGGRGVLGMDGERGRGEDCFWGREVEDEENNRGECVAYVMRDVCNYIYKWLDV